MLHSKQAKQYYIQAQVEDIGNKLNFQCWMSTVEFWMEDEDERPFVKNHINDAGLWKIRSNRQLTLKQYELICEYAAKITSQQQLKNDRRKLSNR